MSDIVNTLRLLCDISGTAYSILFSTVFLAHASLDNSIAENTFFDRWVTGTGILYLRVAVEVDAPARITTFVLDQVSV